MKNTCFLCRVTRRSTWPTKCTARCSSTCWTTSNRRGFAPAHAACGSSTDTGYTHNTHIQNPSSWTLDVPPTWFHPVVVLQVFLHFLLCTALFGCVGAIVDLNSESWLLKGILLACVISVTNVAARWRVRLISLGFKHIKGWNPTCTPHAQKKWGQSTRSCF